MDIDHTHIKLTASELASIFGSYLTNSLAVCVLSYFLEHVEDTDIKPCLKYGLDLSVKHIESLKEIFTTEDIPVPIGFTEKDVDVKAPRLFTDELMLHYVQSIGLMGINLYGMSIPNSARKDIRELYTSSLQSFTELFNRTTDVSQSKGLYIRSPYIPYPKQNEFVDQQHFLAGWIGEQRALTSMEISFLFLNLYRNMFGSSILTGFSQVAQSKEVRKYMTRGAEIAQHYSAVFGKFLGESNLPTPVPWALTATASKEPVFSDKLLMFHTSTLNNAGIGFYGQSVGGSLRKDIAAAYSRLIVEAGEYSLDGAKIMIEHGWMEKPPSAPDRKKLARG
ncbi:DUF3231 family protein [Cytobacillus sp. FJAT-53684]|uniref:DUF3231 family protein n=1 Tax=Cytobacillus mangrovibacter TaxID=3299024 RepID=A0ABW6K2M2_9BACI